MGPTGQEDVEGHRKAMRVETPEGPLGQASVEGESDGSGTDLLAGHEGRVHGSAETGELYYDMTGYAGPGQDT